ncbi:hypothetical protein P154DRAFT_518943 [Amniculicola lignicola CBS 123094]|uniref:F-box domain-containing protein n=1 Tax=Amniculicola lignicola CBS 123094 TaxID=1392246 RepID=A0A6A5WSQ7_9PLEO|nr:hypothetical protein P154DRAFT_518943 [Amniculicola lignicola CBS 123094]
MGIHDLPFEILDEIIGATLPNGIESFALTCKDVYARAIPHIKRHHHLRLHWKHALITEKNALWATHELIRDPLAAEYVETLSMWDPDDREPHRDPALSKEAVASVRDMVLHSEYLEAAGVDTHAWWETMEADVKPFEESHMEAFFHRTIMLLTQLPNLKSLRLFPDWNELNLLEGGPESSKDILTVLTVIVRRANAQHKTGSALGKLQTILPCMAEGYEERFGLQSMHPFFGLRDMTELYAISCLAVDDQYTGIPFQWMMPGLSSPITRLELAYCCMDADGISALLKYTPHLQVFRYSHQTKWHGCQHDWNPGAFTEAIARHCGETITELALTIDELYGDIENGASSFLAFPRLQYLECDVLIFMGPPVESDQKNGMSGFSPRGAKLWTDVDIPCIGSMMPSSIVDIQINTNFPEPDKAALMALLKDIKWQRANRLKRLERVLIRQHDTDTARDLTKEMEIELEMFHEEDVPSSMVPLWKRNFRDRVGGIKFT